MFRKVMLAALCCLAWAVGGPAAHAEGERAQQFIQSLADTAINTVADKTLGTTKRDENFRQLFISAFDIPGIGRFVLGRAWRVATPEQKTEFLKLFEDMTVYTWARRFREYNGEKLAIDGSTKLSDHDWSVASRIIRDQRPPIPVEWRLTEVGGKLAVFDIVVEGVSMAITQRSDFAAIMHANGGKIPALLSNMRTKVDQLRAAG